MFDINPVRTVSNAILILISTVRNIDLHWLWRQPVFHWRTVHQTVNIRRWLYKFANGNDDKKISVRISILILLLFGISITISRDTFLSFFRGETKISFARYGISTRPLWNFIRKLSPEPRNSFFLTSERKKERNRSTKGFEDSETRKLSSAAWNSVIISRTRR